MATKMTLFARPSILFIFPEMQAGVRRVNPLPLTNVSCSPEDWMGATALTEALQIDPPLPRAAAVTSCHQLAQMDTARGTAAETWPETCTSGRPARGDTLPKSRQQTDLKAHDLLGFRHSYGHTRTQMPPASPASRRARACAPLWAHQLNAAGQSSSHHSPAESQEGGAAGGRGGETSKTSGQSRHREA